MEFLSGIPAGGTLFNALAILLGGAIGLFAGRLVSERVQRSIFQCLGLFCLYLGADMALRMQHVLAVLLSFILGTAAGELMDLDVRLNALSDRIKARLRIGSKTFTVNISSGESISLPLSVTWHFGGKYSNVDLTDIVASGTVTASR